MKNSDLNNEYLDDEIDLIELLRTLYSSKKLIVIVTLAFSLLAFIYTTQKELEYQSTVILEIGSYRLLDGEEKLYEPVSSLIKKLKINQISKQLDELKFKSIEDQLLEINFTSPSPEFNETIINEAITFSQESHAEILAKFVNSFSMKIAAIDREVEFIKNSIRIHALNAIKTIDSEIPALESKLKYLLDLIPAEENNLLLLKSNASALLQRASSSPTLEQLIYSYNEQAITLKNLIQNLNKEKEALEMQVNLIAEGEFAPEELFKLNQEVFEMQVKSIAEGEFASEKLFKLNQEKEALEMQVKLAKDQTNSTQPIRELITSEIKTKTLLIILIGTILGFIFSVFIVFIRQAFLKEQN
jgi:LPS O-antigen subunit length determinant protein (WzzB/FepE family)